MDPIDDLPDIDGSHEQNVFVALPQGTSSGAPITVARLGHAGSTGVLPGNVANTLAARMRPSAHPEVPAGGAGSCPFAALSAVIDANGGTLPTRGLSRRSEGGVHSPSNALAGARSRQKGPALPTIGQDEVVVHPAAFGDDEDASSHPSIIDENGSLNIMCPMTGNLFKAAGNGPSGPAAVQRTGSQSSMQRRQATNTRGGDDSASSSGSHRAKSVAASNMRSVQSKKRSGKGSNANGSRKGGGGPMGGGAVSRRDRGVSRKKAPPYEEADVAKHSPYVTKSWSRAMEINGYFELGNLYYDTLFTEAPELAPLFTLERERMGAKFVDMLGAMVSVAGSPPKMHEKLESLAPMHIQRGVRATDMPSMGRVLFAVLHKALGAEFTEAVQEAWGWLWAWLTKSMTLTLEGAGGQSSLVSSSWDICMDSYTEEDLGGMLYDTLFELAPSLKTMFSRPRPVMAMKFVEMVSMLVSFSDDEARMTEQITWLGSRHVKYGAKTHHIPIMGQVLLTVLEQAVGDEWTEEMASAWMDLWNASCAKMMEAIKAGEEYGHVVESLWDKVRKKATASILGQGIVRKLSNKHADFVNQFVMGRKEYAENKQREAQLEQEDKVKIQKTKEKKDEKASAANCLVISTDATPPVEIVLEKTGIVTRLKRKLFTKRMPDIDLSMRRGSMIEVDENPPKKGGHDKSRASKDCHVRSMMLVGEDEAVQAFGIEMYEMLHVVMSLLWEPEQMNERMIVISTRLFQYGLRLEHLDALGDSIHTALRIVLECPCAECGNHEWDDEISGAWGWLWTSVLTSMRKTIGSLEADHAKIVREGWEYLKSIRTSDQIGDAFYTELGREAPFVLHLFQRPKKLQAYMWMQALELLVIFCEVPEKFFEELRHLTIRHIKYGVKAEYIKPFGKAVMTGLEDLFGSRWDPVMQGAWKMLWQRVSTCVSRSLNVGTNLITVSLVNGDLERLQDAIMCAPRNERVSWVCRVEVYGSILSPIYWAIRDGKFEIAQFLISDALAIKADRDNYYYGRQELQDSHPELLTILCRDCPSLVETFMDGLLWHSQNVEEGRLRANYYLAEMFSNPQKIQDAFNTPLAVMCLEGEPQMFGHPIMEKLLNCKWERFGLKMFVSTQLFFMAMVALFTVGYVNEIHSCSIKQIVIKDLVGISAALSSALMLFLISRQLMLGHVLVINFWFFKMPVPRLLTNGWQAMRFVSMAMICASCVTSPCNHLLPPSHYIGVEHHRTMLRSITALFLYIQVMQALVISEQLSALIYAMKQLFLDLARNLFLVLIMLVSFAAALTSLDEPSSGFDSFGNSCWILLQTITRADHPPVDEMQHPFGSVLIIAYLIVAGIGLLSMLIGQFTLAYRELSKDMSGFAKMNRAYVVVEIESLVPLSYRQKIHDELNFQLPLEFDNGDQGPNGGIQVMEPASVRVHPKYCPDRIQRSTGTCSPTEPWPRMIMQESSKSVHGGEGE